MMEEIKMEKNDTTVYVKKIILSHHKNKSKMKSHKRVLGKCLYQKCQKSLLFIASIHV